MDSNYIAHKQSPESPINNSKFVNKIRKIRESSTNYMTVLHSETVIKSVTKPTVGKIRVSKQFCDGQ
jgi:hypothetical protein